MIIANSLKEFGPKFKRTIDRHCEGFESEWNARVGKLLAKAQARVEKTGLPKGHLGKEHALKAGLKPSFKRAKSASPTRGRKRDGERGRSGQGGAGKVHNAKEVGGALGEAARRRGTRRDGGPAEGRRHGPPSRERSRDGER